MSYPLFQAPFHGTPPVKPLRQRHPVKPPNKPFLSIALDYIAPDCRNCKYESDGLCTLFRYSTLIDNQMHSHPILDPVNFYLTTEQCRKEPFLCGPGGEYFKPK